MSTVEGEAHVYRGGSWYYDREGLLRLCRHGLGVVATGDSYRGFRTFRGVREVLPVPVRLERGGSWHNREVVYVRPAMSFGGVAAQGSILRGFRVWRGVRP